MIRTEKIIQIIENLSISKKLLIVILSQVAYILFLILFYTKLEQTATFFIVVPAIISAHLLSSHNTFVSITISALYTIIYAEIRSNEIEFSYAKFIAGLILTYTLSFFISMLMNFARNYYAELQKRKQIEEDLLKKNDELKLYVERLETEIQEKFNTEQSLRKSEEQYRQLVEKANIGIIIDDELGNIKYFNEQLCKITGYSPNEMIKMNIKDIIYDEDYPKVLEKHRNRIEGLNPYERYEFRIKTKQKRILYVEADVSVLKSKNKIIGTKAYIWDITNRKETELALKESEERFRSIYNNATMGFYRMSADGCILMANPKFLEMLKVCEKEILNKKLSEVLEVDEQRENFMELICKQKKVNGYESEWYRKDGALFFGRETAWAIDDDNGNVQYIDVILEDVTLKKQIEEEREQLIQLLQTARSEIKVLSGLLPICASCKRIRDENGNWSNIEQYIDEHSEAKFSHGICPECAAKLYPSAYK